VANNVVTDVATAISRVSIHSGRWKEDEAIALDGPSWTPWLIPRRPT